MAALPLLAACQSMDCQPIKGEVSGDLTRDIIGVWSGFGTDSPVVFDFQQGGKVRIVEAPNMYAPGGNQSTQSFSVDADGGTWTLAGGLAVPFTVTESELIENPDGGVMARPHPRVRCTGFGFGK